MSIADYLPHRLLINHSLRKESAHLRAHIDRYQREYDKKVEQYTNQIEEAQNEKVRLFEQTKHQMIQQLSADIDFYESLKDLLLSYFESYFQKECLGRVIDYNSLEIESMKEYNSFLSSQMEMTFKEIKLLEERKDTLLAQADISEILNLMTLSGCELAEASTDALELLENISLAISQTNEEDVIKKQSLNRLRLILQEKADLLPTIKYITWVIQQKRELCNHLSFIRRQNNTDIRNKTNEITESKKTVKELNQHLGDLARKIRYIWAVPIAELNIDITYWVMRKNTAYVEGKRISERIKEITEAHENAYDWDELIERSDDLYKRIIPKCKKNIESLIEARNEWYERKQRIFDFCINHHVKLLSDKFEKESDELRIVKEKLEALYQKEIVFNAAEQERCRKELEIIQFRRDENERILSIKVEECKKKSNEANATLAQERRNLEKCKGRDSRSAVAKFFSDTTEVMNAKKAVETAEKNRDKADKLLYDAETEYRRKMQGYNSEQTSISPAKYKRSTDEVEEIKKLEARIKELMNPKNNERPNKRNNK